MKTNPMPYPNPEFELYELVDLDWNGKQHKTQIVKRLYDPDLNQWSYEVRGLKQLVNSSVLSPR